MEYLFIISTFLFLVYIGLIVTQYGVLTSLSESYYHLPEKWKWLWPALTINVTVMLGYSWVHLNTIIGSDSIHFLVVLAVTGLIWVGFCPYFKSKHQKIMHYVGAGLALISSVLWSWILGCHIIVLVCYGLGIVMALINRKNYVWWIEMGAFASLFTSVGYLYWIYG